MHELSHVGCAVTVKSDHNKEGPARYNVIESDATHTCDVVFIATGLSVPRAPKDIIHHGGEHMESYATMSTNPNDYINKTVLIFGNGNSAFETANALAEVVAHVWVVGRRRLRYVEVIWSYDIYVQVGC